MIMSKRAYWFGVALAGGAALALLWIQAAMATEGDSPGMLFHAVLAVGVVGALVARFQARGMAWALFATAAAQVVATVIAMAAWGQYVEIGLFNAIFVALWTGSGLLFRRAARVATKGHSMSR
jgi:hypothetical protein